MYQGWARRRGAKATLIDGPAQAKADLLYIECLWRVRRAGARGRAPRERAATRWPLRAPRRGAGQRSHRGRGPRHHHPTSPSPGRAPTSPSCGATSAIRPRSCETCGKAGAPGVSIACSPATSISSRGNERRGRSPPARAARARAMAPLGPVPQRARAGAPSARTTARPATRGTSSRTTTRARASTAGTRTGSAGICDDRQTLCFALAFWNGARPDPEGAHLRADRTEGNHGEDAKEYWWFLDSTPDALVDALALHLPAGGVPVRRGWSAENARARQPIRSSSWSTPGSSTTVATGRSPPTTPRRRPRTCSIRITRAERRPGGGDAGRAADALVPQHLVVGRSTATTPSIAARERRRSSPSTTSSARASSPARGSPEALFCDNETNTRAALAAPRARRRIRRTGSTTTSSTARRPSTREQTGTKAALHYRLQVAAGETATIELRLGRAAASIGDDFDVDDARPRAPRPTSSTPS